MGDQKRKSYRNFNNYNSYNQKKRKQFSLDVGMRGFLCTCNFRESDCVHDAYKLLNDFADRLKKPKDQISEEKAEAVEETQPAEDQEDISESLNKEIDALKAEAQKPLNKRNFQAVDTGVKNVVFIKTLHPDPLELAIPIFEEFKKTQKPLTRFILRLIPVQIVCKAYLDDIHSAADAVFDKFFVENPKTFSIVINRHLNNNVKKEDVIKDLAKLISEKNSENKVDLTKAEVAVVIEIIRSHCLICIAPDYFTYKKYNLLELCGIKEQKKSDMPKEGETVADETGEKKEEEIEAANNDEENSSKENKDEADVEENEEKWSDALETQ